MATTPIQFTDGTEGSASQVSAAFTQLRTQGQTSINQLVVLRENTLLLFQNALSELNGKRVRADRLPTVGIATRFVTSDLQDINQTITTAALRCDANTVSLKERSAPGEATISTITFSASEGTIQALQVPSTSTSGNLGALYRVATSDGSAPVGTFNITLLAPIGVSLVLFDMMDMPSDPTIVVSISTNGITYTPSTNVNRNGYRVGAWFPAGAEAQYIRIAITPALPDILGGNVFTFGLTDFHVFGIQYHLLSNLYTSQIEITPIGAQLQFDAPVIPGIVYFLSLAGNPAIEVNPGDLVDIPGTTVIPPTNHGLVSTNKLNLILPSDTYLASLLITNAANGEVVRIAPGLSPSTTDLTNQYFTLDGSGNMYLVDYVSAIFPLAGGTAEVIAGTPNIATITFPQVAGVISSGDSITISSATSSTLDGDAIVNTATLLSDVWTITFNTGVSAFGVTPQLVGTLTDNTLPTDAGNTYDVSYVTGLSTITAALQVQLSTSDLNTTPLFTGAELIEV